MGLVGVDFPDETNPVKTETQKLRNWDFSLILHQTLRQYGTVIGFNQSNMEISQDLGHKVIKS